MAKKRISSPRKVPDSNKESVKPKPVEPQSTGGPTLTAEAPVKPVEAPSVKPSPSLIDQAPVFPGYRYSAQEIENFRKAYADWLRKLKNK